MLPTAMHIETTTRCVGKCSFCPHKLVGGRPEFMSLETYKTCLDRAQEASIKEFYLYGNGDLICDDRLPELVEMLPQDATVHVYTTLGVELPLAAVRVLERCHVVLSSAELSTAAQEARARNIRKVRVDAVHAPATEVCVEIGKVLAHETGAALSVQPVLNWCGMVESDFEFRDGHCARPREQVFVLTNGKVALCCMDFNGEHSLGDLAAQSIEDIWNSPAAQAYCTELKSKLDPCRRCNHVPQEMLEARVARMGSHMVSLVRALELSDGPVLECGGGMASTSVLHALLAGTNPQRELITAEEDEMWFLGLAKSFPNSPFHTVVHARDWDRFFAKVKGTEWGVVLVDNEPSPLLTRYRSRVDIVRRFVDSETIVVVHDTESPWFRENPEWEKVASLYARRSVYVSGGIETTTLSQAPADMKESI